MTDICHEVTDEIVCPYCGHRFKDSWEISCKNPLDCDECGRAFKAEKCVRVTYSTKRIEGTK